MSSILHCAEAALLWLKIRDISPTLPSGQDGAVLCWCPEGRVGENLPFSAKAACKPHGHSDRRWGMEKNLFILDGSWNGALADKKAPPALPFP